MHHEMMAPKGPVALPKVLGREKIPEPTMDPTTMAVSVNSGSFCTAVLLVAAPLGEAVTATSAIIPLSDEDEMPPCAFACDHASRKRAVVFDSVMWRSRRSD